MDEHALHERSDGEVESGGSDTEGWLEAAAGVWPAWLVAGGAIAVAVLGYAVYEVRSETSTL